MVRIASRRNSTISLDPNLPAFNFRVGFNFCLDKELGEMAVRCHHHQADRTIWRSA
jgi:hypothetical protein